MTRFEHHELDHVVQALREHVAARARCTTDPDADALLLFDPLRTTLAAVRACGRCPVRAECHDLGVLLDARVGVWGGQWFGQHGRSLEDLGRLPSIQVVH